MCDAEDIFSSNKAAPESSIMRFKKKQQKREPLSPISGNTTKKPQQQTQPKLSSSRTPGKTPKKAPGSGPDRFISRRADSQLAHHMIMKGDKENPDSDDEDTNSEYTEKMQQNLNAGTVDDCSSRILAMTLKAPKNTEGEFGMNVVYSKSKPTPSAKAKSTRHISSDPERILDAPDIIDDYYLNLLDWGQNNLIAVPLNSSVYIWNPEQGSVEELFDEKEHNPPLVAGVAVTSERPQVTVSCVKWIEDPTGYILAVGLSNGHIELWDCQAKKRKRTMAGHISRPGSFSWNNHVLSSGRKNGTIQNHDVRIAEHHCSTYSHHTQEVCGLEWSPDKRLLASGSNDLHLCVWDASGCEQNSDGTAQQVAPLKVIEQHTAAVKALSWCPFQRHILASGGGSADRHVRVWNVNSGNCLHSIDTMSQVSDVAWSDHYREIIASHGDQMTIWKYPSMTREAELKGANSHDGRILDMVMSPDGTRVASTGSDETLRLWNCFRVDEEKAKTAVTDRKKVASSSNLHRQSIR